MLALVLLVLSLPGLAQNPARSPPTRSVPVPLDIPQRFLALGDSYTIGEAVPASARWPALLVARLRRDGSAVADPQIVAVTGWTTDELAAGMDAAELSSGYALVTLQIGVNNEYRGRAAGEYREQFAALLARAIALAGRHAERVVVVSIPDWGVTPFARRDARGAARIGAELDIYNAIARDETTRAHARWVDITGLSRAHPELVAADGLHPAAAQYALWVEAILPAARQALRASP